MNNVPWLNYSTYKNGCPSAENRKSTSGFGHPFHIHDVEFHILDINGTPPPAYQDGWKDVVFVPRNTTVRFIARFSDYSDSLKPYMFHCHIATHEDIGMMGQFVVGNSPAGIMNVAQNSKMKLYPNPVKGMLHYEMEGGIVVRNAAVINVRGQVVANYSLNAGYGELDVSAFANGLYFLRLTDKEGKTYVKSYLME